MTVNMPSADDKTLFYTPHEFFQMLSGKISLQSIYYQIRKGGIPSKRLGKKVLIPGDWVRDFFNTPFVDKEC